MTKGAETDQPETARFLELWRGLNYRPEWPEGCWCDLEDMLAPRVGEDRASPIAALAWTIAYPAAGG